MKRLGRVLIISVVLGLGTLCFIAARTSVTALLAQQTVKVVPFVIERQTFNFEKDPNGKLIYRQTLARRSDGTTASVGSVGLIEWGAVTRKIEFMDGIWVSAYDSIGAKTTWHMASNRLAALKQRITNPPANCVFETEGNPISIGNDKVLGHEVVIVQATASDFRTTSWRAQDLGCEDLKFRYEKPNSDGSYKLVSEENAVSVSLGEPSPNYFELRPDMKEMKPSDAHALYFQKLPIPEDENTKKVSKQLDEQYLSGAKH